MKTIEDMALEAGFPVRGTEIYPPGECGYVDAEVRRLCVIVRAQALEDAAALLEAEAASILQKLDCAQDFEDVEQLKYYSAAIRDLKDKT